MNNYLPIITRLVGVSFNGRQRVVAGLAFGEEISLTRDRFNSHDQCAILAKDKYGQQIGFLNRELAKVIAYRFDQFGQPVPATVDAILKSYYGGLMGVRIRFSLPDQAQSLQEDKPDVSVPAKREREQTPSDRIKVVDGDGVVREVCIEEIAPCKLEEFTLGTNFRVKVVLQKSGLSRDLVCKLAATGMVFKIAQK